MVMKRSQIRGIGLLAISITLAASSLACSIEGKISKPVDRFSNLKECVGYYLEKGWAGDAVNAQNWCQTGNNGLERK